MIFIDSWVWLEYLGNMPKSEECRKIIQSSETKIINTAVLLELKYHGTKKFGSDNTSQALNLIENEDSIEIIQITKDIAYLAADLRLKYYTNEKQISFIDTINLATAIISGCKIFYTGDKDFLGIKEIEVKII